jgi:hypothetical protein
MASLHADILERDQPSAWYLVGVDQLGGSHTPYTGGAIGGHGYFGLIRAGRSKLIEQ